MGTIAVIVPVYNVEKYLDECINSILQQTYNNFELILVDDGSMDKSGIMCDLYAKKDSRIYVIHQKNGGLSAARNTGLNYVYSNKKNYNWICFIDSDDYVHKEFLEILFNTGKNENTDLVMCDYTTKADQILLEKHIYSQVINPEDVYIKFSKIINTACAKLYNINLFEKYRFPVGKIMEDAHTTYKVLFEAKKVSVINIPLYFYRINLNGIYHSKWKPERLEAIVATQNQLQFMKDNNYNEALNAASYVYMLTIFKELKYLKETAPEMKKYEKLLRKKLRKAIRQYKKMTGKSLTSENWYYDYAYPCFSMLYWFIKSQIKKVLK